MIIADSKEHIKQTFQQDTPTTTLKIMLVAVGAVIILAGMFVQNKWFLGLMLAWILMP